MSGPLYGEAFKEKLHFVPNADPNHQEEYEISEPALFRFLLNEETIEDQAEIPTMLNTLRSIDKLSKITEVETHQSSMGSAKNLAKAFHVFIVFKTSAKDGDYYWWSLEKNMEYIVLQQSRNKNDVKDKLYGKERKNVKSIDENLAGKGTIKDLFSTLWAYQAISEKYHIFKSNCQSLVTLVSKTITEIGYEFKGYFKYSPQENDRNVEMLDFINILSISFERKGHPLFNLIYHEKPDLFDIVMESGKYDINDTFTDHRITTLHLAIVISSPKMVRHLLEKWKADPTKCDGRGRIALHLAALYAQESNLEIIDLLLEHKKVDINERDLDNRRTALHYAVCACNSIAVRHLIDKGADPNIYDKDGQSPLHLAACHEKGTEIMELILKTKKAEQNDGKTIHLSKRRRIDYVDEEFGTALHMATGASNETTHENLIKKRANINCRDKSGCTPLHLAAAFAQNMKIIELLLENIEKEDVEKQYIYDENIFDYAGKNEKKLGEEIINRLRTKGIYGKNPTFSGMEDESNNKSDVTVASNEKTGITLAVISEKEIETIIQRKKKEIASFEKFNEAKRIFSNDRKKKKLSADTEVAFDTQIKIMLPFALENKIIESDVEKVQNFIDEGKDISKVTWENGANALHVAAKWAKTTEMIDVIKENGKFDINGVDSIGYTPLHYALLGTTPTIDHEGAVYNKYIELFDLFLKPEKVDIDSGKSGRPAQLMNESNVTTTRYLIEKGADPNIAIKGWTPFLLAARFAKDFDIFRLFLNKKLEIDVNCKTNGGWNALHFVCRYYDKENLIDIIRLLIEKNINVNYENEGWNALLTVCQFYNKKNLIDIVRLLIDKNIDVNSKNNDGDNALTLLGQNYNKVNLIEIVRLLIEKKIDVNCKQNDGWNALHLVCQFYNKENLIDIVQLLIDKNIYVNCKTNDEWNALNLVCRFYDKENLIQIVRLLIEKDINVNCKTNDGNNALTFLCQNYDKENLIDIVRLLIDKNIDIDCKNEDGWNALHYVCRYYDKENLIEIIRLLIDKEIDVNCKIEGWNALLTVCRYYDKENLIQIVRLLIEKDIDVNCKTNSGNDALTLLCRNYDKENLIDIVRLLIDNKIDVNNKQNEGWNALHLVCYYSSESRLVDLVRLLVQHKIDKKAETTGFVIGTARSFLLIRFKEEEIKNILRILD